MNKRVLGLFIIFPSCYISSCSMDTVNVNVVTNNYCTSENITSAKKNENLSIKFYPKDGCYLDESCFTITIGVKSISTEKEGISFEDNKLVIDKYYITGDVSIIANAIKSATMYSVDVDHDETIQEVEPFPSEVLNTEDLTLKFKVQDNYGFDNTITIGNELFENYNLSCDDGIFTLTIDEQYISGDISITFNTEENKLTLSKQQVDIKNYDTCNVYVLNSSGGELTYSKDETAFDVSKNGTCFTIDSKSNDVCEYKPVKIIDGSNSATFYVTVHHPKNVEEALDSTTLGFIRDNSSFDLTFAYTNTESFTTFSDHLEISENMYEESGSGLTANYKTGSNVTNTFTLTNINKHGRNYGDLHTTGTSKLYSGIDSANYEISKNSLDSSESTIALDKSDKTIKVYNSEELFWAVEHGYIPTFDTGTYGVKAKEIYEIGRKIIKEETRDSMSDFDEFVALFNYLENNITYDFNVIEITQYLQWLKYSAYFLEGVFLDDGLAVCDGFSKAYAFLCGLDSLPCIRSFGYTNTSGHAWNYIKVDGGWYLVCPTWAQQNISKTDINFYGKNFALYSFDSFLKSKKYFKENGGSDYDFSDNGFPNTVKESQDYDTDVYTLMSVGNTGAKYYVNSKNEMQIIFDACSSAGLSNKEFFVVMERGSSIPSSQISNYVESALKNSSLKYSDYGCLGSTGSSTIYCVFK